MGQLLSHPIEDKTIDYRPFESLTYCVGSMQGYRMTMEDAHNVKINEDESLAVFGVFDGHGGKSCADFISDALPASIFRGLNGHLKKSMRSRSDPRSNDIKNSDTKSYNDQKNPDIKNTDNKNTDDSDKTINTDSDNKKTSDNSCNQKSDNKINNTSRSSELSAYMKIIKNCFFKVDHDLPESDSLNCGSTAIVTTIVANKYIIVANTGDSRSIMSLSGGASKTLSFDHKPSTMSERVRIENSGGYVVSGRVNEILALSRAFGDFKFKFPYIELSTSANINNNKFLEANKKFFKNDLVHLPPELFQVSVEPDLLVYDLTLLKQPEFIILACDGIWDCYTNTQLIGLIRHKIAQDWKLNHITEFILNDCIGMASNVTGVGFDNMTLIIIAIHTDCSIDEWYQIIKARVKCEDQMKSSPPSKSSTKSKSNNRI